MLREFVQVARTGKNRLWTIEVVGRKVITTFGEEGGKMQTVVDEGQGKNLGRTNEVSPEEDAEKMANRQILLKTRQGYVSVRESVVPSNIDWHLLLPQNLCFYKPDNTLSVGLEKKLEDGSAWLTRKRDGEMMVIVKNGYGEVDIYSRRMLTSHHLEVGEHVWGDRFQHLVDEVEGRDDIPPGTILLGDMVADIDDDRRWEVASVMKSSTDKAVQLQEHSPLFFYCWDVAFWEYLDFLSTSTVRERFTLLRDMFGRPGLDNSWILPLEVVEVGRIERELPSMLRSKPKISMPETNREKAIEYAKRMGWEGWVVVDPDGKYGDRAYNFRGKPDRPGRFCGKLKPAYDDDFLALFDPDNIRGHGHHGKWGKGNHRGQVGSVALFQFTSKKDLVYICDCGGGIDDEFRAKYSNPMRYPLVLQVVYTERTYTSEGDKTDALTHPRMVMVRDDKLAEECINERL